MAEGRWRHRKNIGLKITRLFEEKVLDPRSYIKASLGTIKQKYACFSSLGDVEWWTAFRRAASEYNLQKDLETVEREHSQSTSKQKSDPKVRRLV